MKEIENVPTTADKPNDDVVIVDCGELVEEEAPADEAPAYEEAMKAETPETED